MLNGNKVRSMKEKKALENISTYIVSLTANGRLSRLSGYLI